ncbi:hypothetical protein CASFOL_009274 [Castilleja foliolosa]|uniref:PWWP domain-containing protein n=1 Tax=Castilleja foliolosa TaxID=1961234 RepID=A0ABD3DWV8_9LAMI
MVLVNLSSGITGELNEGPSGGMVDGAESKTPAENHSDKGVWSEGVRVSDGESNNENVIIGNRKEPFESCQIEIGDERDINKNRAVEVRSRSNRWDSWESWGVMNMVGRVLGGKFSMDDDDLEDVNTSENGREAKVVEDKVAWRGVIGEPMSVCKSDDEKTVANRVKLEVANTSEIRREANVVANEGDVKSIVVDKVTLEDVNTSEIRREANVVEDKDTWQGVIGEPILGDKSDVGCIVVENVSPDKENTSEIIRETDVAVDKVVWQGVIGEPMSVDKSDVEKIVVDKVMLEEINISQNGCEADVVEDKATWEGVIGESTYESKSDVVSNFVVKGASVDNSDIEKTVFDEVMLEEINPSQDRCEADVVEDKDMCRGVIGETASEIKIDIEKIMVDEVMLEDVNTSGNGCEANMVVDKDTWQGVTGEPISVNQCDVESIIGEKKLDELMSDDLVVKPDSNWDKDSVDLVKGTGLKGDHQNLVSNELVPAGMMETDVVNEAEVDTFLIPKTRGEHQITEKEGEYCVLDLVWGKVKSHPWWPGQIFPPIAASDKATKHFRKQSYLIAYFGDRSFAWNEGSNIRPFRMHFSQMEKQSNSDGFCHAVSCALDEVTRRVESGLSCPCLSEEVHDKIKTQVVSNAGILEDKNIIDGGDHLSGPTSFLPGNLVQFLESAAELPKSITDRLQFTVAKAQLLAFSRWKGQYELPVFEQYIGMLEDDVTQVTVKEDRNETKKGESTARDGSSQKRKHPSSENDCPATKQKRISALMSSSSLILPNVDEKPIKGVHRSPNLSGNSNPREKRLKRLLPSRPVGDGENNPELKISEESELVEIILDEIPTSNVILSKLILAAKVPMQGLSVMISEVDFLREFRNLICLEKKPTFGNAEMDNGKQPASLETADASGLGSEGIEDSYWTDRIIQGYSQKQVLLEPQNPNDTAVQVEEEAGIKERETVVENQPTALILNFTNLDSIPDVANLNEIFGRYGPLKESETEILRKSKRVKVIFKRRGDAETAFSSTGKYSIFGPSLVSYRLHYDPTPHKTRGKRNKKDLSLKDDA